MEGKNSVRHTTDEEGNYYCKEFIPAIAGTYSGTLAIIGGGKNMWEEWENFKAFSHGHEYDTMAVNIAGLFIPKLEHLFSLHYKQISYISNFRKVEYGVATKHLTHTTGKEKDGIDYVWYLAMRTSTSGFMATILGHLLGYERMVLIGVPMDGSGYFYKPSLNRTFEDDDRYKEIQLLKQLFPEKLKSMSGRSRITLGLPTKEWLEEKNYASTK